MKRPLESIIYASLWLLALTLFILDNMRVRSYTEQPLLDLHAVGHILYSILPLLLLFVVNNYLLIPRFLKKGRYSAYFLSAAAAVLSIWLVQGAQFVGYTRLDGGVHVGPRHPGPTPLLPLPLFLDLIYDLLIVGVNVAISMIFQNLTDRLARERLMKENAQNQLNYLKAQINPHFYLNMLNNIHGLIEINPEKAQDMVINMSRLMRYMLYDSSRAAISLSSEVDFMRDYLSTMRVRYPEDVVGISADLPDIRESSGIAVPPLIFLVFIENAFKHGISYADRSYVGIYLAVSAGKVDFRCRNSVHDAAGAESEKGIGLENVRRRLDIIYGDSYSLETRNDYGEYAIRLILPHYEIEDIDN